MAFTLSGKTPNASKNILTSLFKQTSQEFESVIQHAAKLNGFCLPSCSSFTQKYFADGRKVSYDQFHELLKELNLSVLMCKWKSLKPDADNTVSLVRRLQIMCS